MPEEMGERNEKNKTRNCLNCKNLIGTDPSFFVMHAQNGHTDTARKLARSKLSC